MKHFCHLKTFDRCRKYFTAAQFSIFFSCVLKLPQSVFYRTIIGIAKVFFIAYIVNVIYSLKAVLPFTVLYRMILVDSIQAYVFYYSDIANIS